MRRYLGYLFFIFILFWLETGARQVFPEARFVIPELSLVVVVVFAVRANLRETVTIGMFSGFLGELISGQYFGATITATLLVGIAVHFATRSVAGKLSSLSSTASLIIVATLFFPLLVYLYNQAASPFVTIQVPRLRDYYQWKLIYRLIVNLLFVVPVSKLFKTFFYE